MIPSNSRQTPVTVNQLHESEPRWFAVHTRSKSEKFVQRMLTKKGIHAWLPLQKLMRRYVRSTRMVEKPLINCYVFVRIVQREYVPVLEKVAATTVHSKVKRFAITNAEALTRRAARIAKTLPD